MAFCGQIEDFPVMDIMQYIHRSKKSGTLYVEESSHKGWVDFQGGQIVQAGLPQMTNLGDMLIRGRRISLSDLQKAVIEQRKKNFAKPLGMVLEDMGVISHRDLRKAVIAQIEEVVYELSTWEKGSFRFDLGSHETPDEIAVAPAELISPEEIDTRNMLLEAISASQNGKNPHKNKDRLNAENENPERCADEGLFAIPASNGHLHLLRQMIAEGRKKDKSQSVSRCFLKLLSRHMERAILFMVRKEELIALGAVGQTSDRKELDQSVKNLKVPLEHDSLPQKCISARAPYYGEHDHRAWVRTIHEKIGPPLSSRVTILPVAGVEKVMCLVYGDTGPIQESEQEIELLEVAAGQAGMILENTFLMKKLKQGE